MKLDEISQQPGRSLPAGLVLRVWGGQPPVGELAERLSAIANTTNLAEGVDETVSPAELVNWLSRPGPHFDATHDLLLVEREGEPVAYGWLNWVDTTDGLREYRLSGYVHPDWQRRGIAHAIVGWEERHAAQHLAAHPTPKGVVLGSWAPERRRAKRRLLEGRGYVAVRWFFDMLRPDLEAIELPELPAGIELRPMGADRAAWRRLFDADAEAFRDHWGGFSAGDEDFEMWVNDPFFDPSLFVVAWDGDEIAGAVINAIYADDNRAYNRRRAWLDSVFVRRPWRRRGLASALVRRSLLLIRERGMAEAMLGVDSDNPSGALGLYERAGFRVHNRSIAYRKPMVAGSDG